MKPYTISFFLSILLIVGCCEPQYKYNKALKNESSYDIWVIISKRTNGNTQIVPIDSFFVKSNTQNTIYSGTGIHSLTCVEPLSLSLHSKVSENEGLIVVKDLNKEDEWLGTVAGTDCKGSITQCIFTITDADIVPK